MSNHRQPRSTLWPKTFADREFDCDFDFLSPEQVFSKKPKQNDVPQQNPPERENLIWMQGGARHRALLRKVSLVFNRHPGPAKGISSVCVCVYEHVCESRHWATREIGLVVMATP